ncbi:MAG: hypothetical protein H0X13_12275 [Ramlibacter sp.]|nr:hypothetical protein [Ramlibacter sp.]
MLDETRRELSGKKDRYSQAPMLLHPAVLRVLEKAEGTLHLATTGMRTMLSDLWERAKTSKPLSESERIMARNATSAGVLLGTDLVRSVFDVSGTTAIRRNGQLERLFRDANCLAAPLVERLRLRIHPPSARRLCATRRACLRLDCDASSSRIL